MLPMSVMSMFKSNLQSDSNVSLLTLEKRSLKDRFVNFRFGLSSKKDKFSPERNSKLKRSFRSRPATPRKLMLAE